LRYIGKDLFVSILPAVEYTDLIKATSTFHFGLIPWKNKLPQKKFSMPNKFFEYVLSGVPIICTNKSELSQVVEQHGLGLVYTNQHDLAFRINNLTDSTYSLFQENLEKYVLQNGHDVQMQKYMKLFRSL
jgi:glycosyltransferase involved in cell wall biosynthesis